MSSPEVMVRSQGGQTPKIWPKPASQELLSQLPSSTTGCIPTAKQEEKSSPTHPWLSSSTCPGAFIYFLFSGIVLKGFP